MKAKFVFWVIFVLLGAVVFAQNPATDFDYQLNSTGDGVMITKYKGRSPTVVIPGVIEGFPVKEIRASTFQGNKIVTSVTIPDTVTKLDDSAFSSCENLKSVHIPDSIVFTVQIHTTHYMDGHEIDEPYGSPSSLFNGCRSLTSVRLPNNITIIPQGTFTGCTSLKAFTFPPSVKYIGHSAFNSSGIETIKIPEGVEYLPDNNQSIYGVFWKCKSLTEVYLPSTLKRLGANSFAECSNLVNVHIPSNIESLHIGNTEFRGCPKLPLATQAALRKLGYIGNF